MATVTQVVNKSEQPRGGYLNPKDFKVLQFNDKLVLTKDNISASLIGLAVDYLTRFLLSNSLEESFEISLKGAKNVREEKKAKELLKKIKGLDDESIYNACKLVGYDVAFRAGPLFYKSIDEIDADVQTLNNIRIMVNRSLKFFDVYGPVISYSFTFEGGYTSLIDAGDGDYLTNDTLWDFKVLSNKITSKHTLQILIYYIMGKHSIHEDFCNIDKIGIFNPRLNTVYLKEVKEIDRKIIEEVSKKIIGYIPNNI